MFAATVYFPRRNVDLYMLFDIFVYFMIKEKTEEEQNFLQGRKHSHIFHKQAIKQSIALLKCSVKSSCHMYLLDSYII